MKKIISTTLIVLSLISLLFATGLIASASFGLGAEVIASDVDLIKTGLSGKKISFTDADFKSALCIEDFKSITITEIPKSTEGTLLLNGRRVGTNKEIKRSSLATLVFIPASDSVEECSFKFTVKGYASGAEIECTMKFIDKINYAPKTIDDTSSASQTVKTQESVSYYGNLAAEDPEGDALEYFIVSYPKRGAVSIISDDGRYSYTPNDGFCGKDKFVYVVRDEYGNYSEPTTVNVRVNERMCETVYNDMTEREEYNAALAMTAMGVMNGRMLGDDLYFEPDKTITRAEFVAMAMKALGKRVDTTITASYFDDDGEISESLKGYVATAQRLGYINGDFKDGKLLFSPNGEITKYEAAKILSAMLGTEALGEESVFAIDENIPIWARAGVNAMRTLGIFGTEDTAALDTLVTRANAASYLYKALNK